MNSDITLPEPSLILKKPIIREDGSRLGEELDSDFLKKKRTKPHWKLIEEAAKELGGIFSPKSIIKQIRKRYPDLELNEQSFRADIAACCINHPSRRHYPGARHNVLYRVARGKYRLYTPEIDVQEPLVVEHQNQEVRGNAPRDQDVLAENTEKFVKVCAKLDELRFDRSSWPVYGARRILEGRKPAPVRLLLFWMCCSIDMFYPAKTIWKDGEAALDSLLDDYNRGYADVEGHILPSKGNQSWRIVFSDGEFTLVRDMKDRIQNTLDYLGRFYDGDITSFLEEIINDSRNHGPAGLQKIGYFVDECLFSGNSKVAARSMPTPTDRELKTLLKKSRKRLWMFLMFLRRDPPIRQLFQDALNARFGESGAEIYHTWIDKDKYSVKDLPMPTDMWNERLFNAMGVRIALTNRTNAKKAAQELWQRYENIICSPSVFDVTFSLGSALCVQGDHGGCPFGDNYYCQPDNFCTLAEKLFKQKVRCTFPNCAIGQNQGKNLCTRDFERKKARFKH